MTISRGDRFKLVCYLAKLPTFEAFSAAYKVVEKKRSDEPTDSTVLRRAYNRWLKGASYHTIHEDKLYAVFSEAGIVDPRELLEKEVSVPAFLHLVSLPYDEVRHFLSDAAQNEWSASHHNLYFMAALDTQASKPKARAILQAIKGTYRLYRRHSMLPGLLREWFVIDEIKDGHCEGWYIQFARAGAPNIIPFNAFFCEFYVIAFGAHEAVGRRTEIVTVSVSVENAFSGENVVCDAHSRHYIGLLTGIYDYGNILLAERVLIEKVSDVVEIEKRTDAKGKVHLLVEGHGPTHILKEDRSSEYMKAIDVIDNSLDGQTLTARVDRLALVR